jgi:tetratricopeptide (TPR) repeat protein
VQAAHTRAPEAWFLGRRAMESAVEAGGEVGAALSKALRELRATLEAGEAPGDATASLLVRAGAALERAGNHAGARSIFELAAELRPSCATTRLHAGRAARQSGAREVALAHYTRAQSLDADGRVARLARIGEAMLSQSAERKLSVEIRRAVRDGDPEAAGVGLEARATLRCETERCRDAIRDLCVCALRYPDREDRSRAAERVAELLVREREPHAAREALLLVHEIGTAAQRASASAQLYRLSLELGDTLGARRWGGPRKKGPAPEGAIPRAAGESARESGRATVLRDWRAAVERSAGAR